VSTSRDRDDLLGKRHAPVPEQWLARDKPDPESAGWPIIRAACQLSVESFRRPRWLWPNVSLTTHFRHLAGLGALLTERLAASLPWIPRRGPYARVAAPATEIAGLDSKKSLAISTPKMGAVAFAAISMGYRDPLQHEVRFGPKSGFG
jgi:hypothetical protein